LHASLPPRPRGRFWLYAPFAALALLACLWSIAWMVIRDRTTAALDAWLEAEAAAGRRWTCADRTVAGFPFRLEIGCGSVSLDRPEGSAKLGRLVVVAQVYEPGHFVAEATGPLQARIGRFVREVFSHRWLEGGRQPAGMRIILGYRWIL